MAFFFLLLSFAAFHAGCSVSVFCAYRVIERHWENSSSSSCNYLRLCIDGMELVGLYGRHVDEMDTEDA